MAHTTVPIVGSGGVKSSTMSTESTGFPIFEFHGTSFGGGALLLTGAAIIGILIYFCLRYRRRSNRQRQWILELGGPPEVAQGWGRHGGRRHSDGGAAGNSWVTKSSGSDNDQVWGRLEELFYKWTGAGPVGYSVPSAASPAHVTIPMPEDTRDGPVILGTGACNKCYPVQTARAGRAGRMEPQYIYRGPPIVAASAPFRASAPMHPSDKRADFVPPFNLWGTDDDIPHEFWEDVSVDKFGNWMDGRTAGD